ncbi:MAG: hypothetical protein WCI37_02445 [bacterium]
MLALAFLEWYYTRGWFSGYNLLGPRLKRTYYGFSVPILARTLFSPWKRIITISKGGLSTRFNAILDNIVSRCVGFVVRLFTIFSAFIICIFWIVLAIFQLIVWPLLPIAGIILIILGVL